VSALDYLVPLELDVAGCPKIACVNGTLQVDDLIGKFEMAGTGAW
jgi:hypothetical protein